MEGSLISRWDKFRQRLLSGRADQNIDFESLCAFLRHLGFDEDISGSHHIFGRDDIREIITIQPRNDGKAKAYQVKQGRKVIEDNGL